MTAPPIHSFSAAPWWQQLSAAGILLFSLTWVSLEAVPVMWTGADNLRMVRVVVSDEEVILSGAWLMADEGSLQHGINVYPDLYPLLLAAVRLVVGEAPTATHVAAARLLSLVALWLAILVPFVMMLRLRASPLVLAVFSAILCLHPEVVRWTARVHPDTLLILFDHAALVFLALYAREQRQRYLYAATAVSALSAGIKLVGFFVMACICAWCVWLNRRDWRTALRLVVVQGAFFLLVFIAVNPQLFVDAAVPLNGWVRQNRSNRHGSGMRLDWVFTLVGPRGLGVAGCAVVLWGLVRVFMGKLDHGLVAVASFGLFFFAYLLVSVSIVVPRYAFPATLPLLFIGLHALAADLRRHSRPAMGAAIGLVAVLVMHDAPAALDELRANRDAYARVMTPQVRELADYLRRVEEHSPGPVVSFGAATVYVPPEIRDWRPVWKLDALPPEQRACRELLVVVDPRLRAAGGEFYDQVVAGETHLVLRETIGVYDIYVGPQRAVPD